MFDVSMGLQLTKPFNRVELLARIGTQVTVASCKRLVFALQGCGSLKWGLTTWLVGQLRVQDAVVAGKENDKTSKLQGFGPANPAYPFPFEDLRWSLPQQAPHKVPAKPVFAPCHEPGALEIPRVQGHWKADETSSFS